MWSSKPDWLKVKLPAHKNFFDVSALLKENGLNTICQSARCPNISECWTAKTATFLILGDTCTRACAFCAVKKGTPVPPSEGEPGRVAEAVRALGLDYAVITSVTRDDLPDGGAALFAGTVRAVRLARPGTKVEVLVPDFQGREEPLRTVLDAKPDILNHNLEVPESLYPHINRPTANYGRSLRLLERAKELGAATKSGLMIGLGERLETILQTFSDLRKAGCDLLTIGQYLRPSRDNAPVEKYYTPEEFNELKSVALDFGFLDVESGPLVRSSYQAHKLYRTLQDDTWGDACAT